MFNLPSASPLCHMEEVPGRRAFRDQLLYTAVNTFACIEAVYSSLKLERCILYTAVYAEKYVF